MVNNSDRPSRITWYAPVGLVADVDDFRVGLRRTNLGPVDRSRVISACVQLALRDFPDTLVERLEQEGA